MDKRTRAYVASAGIVGIFLLVQVGALALVAPFDTAGYQAVEDPQNPTNSVVYLVAILAVTGLMLVALNFDLGVLIRLLLVGSAAYISLFVVRLLVPPAVVVDVAGAPVNLLAWALAVAIGVALWVYPEWYVIDAAGVLMGAGAAALFGISFGVLPALVLLAVLAVYDAVSVYGTEHMLTLASGVMDLKVPIVLVVPLSLSYSYLSTEPPDPAEDGSASATTGDESTGPGPDPLDREALFIGLGDAVIPSVLVASAAFFSPASVGAYEILGVEATLPALTAMAGTVVGLVVLLRMVLRGRAHAGLPLLNGGTIAGYLIGALASGMTLAGALGLEAYL